jgi:Transglutaminase-like superfamily
MSMRALARLEPAEVALLLHALLVVARIRIALLWRPWRLVLAHVAPPDTKSSDRFGAERLEWAVRTAGRVVPGATCLTQALALSHLLSRSGHASIVQIGVTNEGGQFAAHAWVECHGAPLLGSAADLTRYSRLLTWSAAQPNLFQ